MVFSRRLDPKEVPDLLNRIIRDKINPGETTRIFKIEHRDKGETDDRKINESYKSSYLNNNEVLAYLNKYFNHKDNKPIYTEALLFSVEGFRSCSYIIELDTDEKNRKIRTSISYKLKKLKK
ncbi:hypothetical protein J4446_03090 [Candidatus Woesearchaeota archaeon]|nr:hypothetical protein [Candidatus Woesearchaeota archaeon]